MDLNHIELPAFVIADMYRHSLVEPGNTIGEKKADDPIAAPGTSLPVEAEQQSGWKSLGNNGKNILVIVDHKGIVHLPDEELNFLSGILAACKLGMDDISLVNLQNHLNAGYKDFSNHFKCKTVLLFGVEPVRLGLPMSFPHFQPQSFANISYLYSPALIELEKDKLLKSKLWVCLKRIFGV